MEDYSQHGEFERLIRPYYTAIGVEQGSAVELGVHGEENSNTLNLVVEEEWKALWIDASERAIKLCHEDLETHKVSHRVSVIHGAVVPKGQYQDQDTVPVFIHDVIGHDSLLDGYGSSEQVTVEQALRYDLCHLLEGMTTGADFDFLSVDLEGSDEAVLLDFLTRSTFRPKGIMIERSSLGASFPFEMNRFGYFRFAANKVNEFWVREFKL